MYPRIFIIAVLCLLGCSGSDPLEEYLDSHPSDTYETLIMVPCLGSLRSEYPVSDRDVVKNFKLARTILNTFNIVETDLFCDRFLNAHVTISRTEQIEPGILGSFDGKKISVGNNMEALLHEMLHYIDFLRREPEWSTHSTWSQSYLKADNEFTINRHQVCFKLDGDIVCHIQTVTIN